MTKGTEVEKLQEKIGSIKPLCREAAEAAAHQWNSIAKPLHSLGLLEDGVIQIAGITGSSDVKLTKRCVVVMCADNGVVAEGVSQTDSSVTAIVAKTMAEGTSNINWMAKQFGAEVFPVDIGMKEDVDVPGLIRRKIAYGTENIRKGPAMTTEQAARAVREGIDQVKQCKDMGMDIIVTGEMGIGNTTTSAALASVLLGEEPEQVTGRGAGLDEAGLQHKIQVIRQAIAVNEPDASKPLELLAKLGGYDIAGMTGVFLGGAIYRIPIVIDGMISAVAAILAAKLAPSAGDYQLCSHVSREPAGAKLLELLGKMPLLTAQMCLGEGTGGVCLLPLLDGALAVYHSTHSFQEIQVDAYKDYGSEKGAR